MFGRGAAMLDPAGGDPLPGWRPQPLRSPIYITLNQPKHRRLKPETPTLNPPPETPTHNRHPGTRSFNLDICRLEQRCDGGCRLTDTGLPLPDLPPGLLHLVAQLARPLAPNARADRALELRPMAPNCRAWSCHGSALRLSTLNPKS